MKVKVLLEPGDDGWVVASIPAFRGCHSQGRTREEALANIREAAELWLECQDEMSSRTASPTAEHVLVTLD